MEIKEYTDEFFNNSKKIIIYNSYEPYYLYEMKKYYKQNNIECIDALDTDLDVFLPSFNNVKYIYLNSDAVHLNEINKLSNLNGISLTDKQLNKIDLKILEQLEYLEINYISQTIIDFNTFKSLKHLRLRNYPFNMLDIQNELISFSIDNAPKLNNLKGVNTNTLKKLKVENNKKLETIELNCPMLISFEIYDSKKVINLEKFIESCKNVTDVSITAYSDYKAELRTIKFIEELTNLKTFITNFKILDGDLKPLLKLNDANIVRFYKNYNLKDKDLPHIEVFIREGNIIKVVQLDSLELGKEDPRIMWMD